ncbi:MAG TPA: beta-propeller fold lactonase family protein [Vicinamibacterales bacterium]
MKFGRWVALCLLALGASLAAAADVKVSAADTLVLATDQVEDKVTVFRAAVDGRLTQLIRIGTGKGPENVVVTADGGTAYISNGGDDTISVLDLAALKVVRTLSHPRLQQSAENRVQTSFGLAVSPDGQKLYVAGRAQGALLILSPAGQLLSEVPVANVSTVALTPDGSRVFAVGFESQKLVAIDTRTNAVIGSIATGRHPRGISFTPDGKTLILGLVQHDAVQFVDTQTLAVKAISGAGRSPQSSAVSADGQLAYVGTRDVVDGNVLSHISVVNLRNDQFRRVQYYLVGTMLQRIAISSDGAWLYATCRSLYDPEASLAVMDLRTMEHVQFVAAGSKALGLAIRSGR